MFERQELAHIWSVLQSQSPVSLISELALDGSALSESPNVIVLAANTQALTLVAHTVY